MSEETTSVEQKMRRMSRRSFLWAAMAVAGGYGGWRWLTTRRDEAGIGWPFRRVLETNAQLGQDLFSTERLSPTFPISMAVEPRVNNDIGMEDELDPDAWRLVVEGLTDAPVRLTLDEIRKIGGTDVITELRCIEGWSAVVHWTGAPLASLVKKLAPELLANTVGNVPDSDKLPAYVSLVTPNEGYYVGLDLESALHPQTLLCWAMSGKSLPPEHGAPLRLVIPVKYGIKHLKRLGAIRFVNERPADYWAEQGYDWYSGH